MGYSNSKSRSRPAERAAQDKDIQERNVSMTLASIIQQLERLERVIEGSNRTTFLERNPHGDTNHTTIEANQTALGLKLMCLTGILLYYNNAVWNMYCLSKVQSWYQERRGNCSSIVIKAVQECVNACRGKCKKNLPFSIASLQSGEVTQGLYQACEDYRLKTASNAFLEEIQSVHIRFPEFDFDLYLASLESELAEKLRVSEAQSQIAGVEVDLSPVDDALDLDGRSTQEGDK